MTATVTASTDQASYNPGDTVTLTVNYADDQTVSTKVSVTVSATDASGATVTGLTTFAVQTVAPQPMQVTASDDHNDVYVKTSDDGKGLVVFTTTAPAS